MSEEDKKRVASKTYWINGAFVAIAVANQLMSGGLIPPEWLPLFTTGIAVANIILREFTTKPLAPLFTEAK
jgi:hypothetical protein